MHSNELSLNKPLFADFQQTEKRKFSLKKSEKCPSFCTTSIRGRILNSDIYSRGFYLTQKTTNLSCNVNTQIILHAQKKNLTKGFFIDFIVCVNPVGEGFNS